MRRHLAVPLMWQRAERLLVFVIVLSSFIGAAQGRGDARADTAMPTNRISPRQSIISTQPRNVAQHVSATATVEASGTPLPAAFQGAAAGPASPLLLKRALTLTHQHMPAMQPDQTPYAVGDVFVGVGDGEIDQFSPAGSLLATLNTTSGNTYDTGMCFDAAGNLYATDFGANNVSKFDSQGNLIQQFWGSGFNADPESCVVDNAGNIYVGQADGSAQILKFDASGNLLATFSPATEDRGTDWIDLAADQCTMYYTSEGSSVKRFNVCTNTQLSDFATGLAAPCYAHRIRANGQVIVACASQVYLLNVDGSVAQTYAPDPSNDLFALNVDPDGTSFWTADLGTGQIWKIDIATGNVLLTFNANVLTDVGGLAVFGEQTTGCPSCGGGPIGGPPAPGENLGGSNPSEPQVCSCHDSIGSPVDTATGDFYHTFSDISIPGRGLALNFSHTYNSLAASTDGPLGFGWTFSYGLSLAQDPSTGAVTVTQEDGSQVTFALSGTAYTAPPRVVATLVKNGDGSFTFTRDARETITFSSTGQLMAERDLNGYVTSFGYNGLGQLTAITDTAGRAITLGWTGTHITSITDPIGRRVLFGYNDGQGNLTDVTDVGGGVTHFTYDTNHLLLTMTDPRGGTITNAYDAADRVITQTAPLGRTTSFTYTVDNTGVQTTTVTDPNGNVTLERYQFGLRIAVTKGYGTAQAATWHYTYDPATLGITSATDPNGHVTTMTYDANANMLSSTDPLSRTTSYAYDALNDTTAITDPLGVTTVMTYDANGNLLQTAHPLTQTGQVATITLTYDPAHPGDVIARTDPNGHTTTFTYDAYGNMIRSSDPLSDTTTSRYDLIGRMISTVSPSGAITGANPLSYTTTMAYNAFGDTTAITDPLGHRTTYQYDPNRNLIAVTDALGHVTSYQYDLDNELTTTILPTGAMTATGYDADGNVVSQTDALSRTTTYAYDPLNRLISQTDPLGRATTYGYDSAGNRTSLTDAMGRTTTYGYDGANELTSVTYSDGTTPNVFYTYTLDGQRATMTDGTGTTTYSYDSLNRLTGSTNGAGQNLGYGYDLAGNLTTLTYPDGSRVTRGYDAANRLISVSDWLGHTTRFAYDPNGNLLTQTYPNATTSTRTYNQANQLTAITDRRATSALWTFSYGRDPLGQVSTSVDPLERLTHAYSYTRLNQLIADAQTSGTTTHHGYWANDAAYEVTAMLKTSGAYSQLTYDPAGEVLSRRTTVGISVTSNLAYSYNADGDRTGQHDSVSGATFSVGYDQADRLITITTPLSSAAYIYNGDGLRMSKTISGTLTAYAWDTAEGLPLILQDGSIRYVTGPGGLPLEGIIGTSTVLYFYQDQLGSTRALLASTGQVAVTYTYDPYGARHVHGSIVSPFGYAGQYTDAETGLIYMRARYYDPASDQFLTRDPLASVTGHLYAYVADDPVNTVDPSGQIFGLDTLVAIGVGAGLGFIGGVAEQGALDVVTGNYSGGWQELVASGVGGAVTGAATAGVADATAGIGTYAGYAIGSAEGAIAKQEVEDLLINHSVSSWQTYAGGALLSGITGGFAGIAGQVVAGGSGFLHDVEAEGISDLASLGFDFTGYLFHQATGPYCHAELSP